MSTALIWAAGLFEGEGSISISFKKHYCYLQLVSTDEDVIDRFLNAVGCGSKTSVKRRPGQTKDIWKWQVANKPAVTKLLNLFLPFLSLRRAFKAQNCLDYYDNCFISRD